MTPVAMGLSAAGALAGGIVDARTGFIPNVVTFSTFVAASAASAAGGELAGAWHGALASGGMLLALHVLTRGRGIGLGDVKLAAAIGAGLGPAGGAVSLAAAFAFGGMFGVWLLATRRARRGDAVRFGPFLAAGTVVAIACGAPG